MSEASRKLLALWSDRVSLSGKYLEQVKEENKWETYIDQLKGKYDVVLGNSYVPPIGEVYAYCEASKANLFAQNPYIAVNAKKEGTIQGSYIWEALLNHDWAEMHCKDDVELEIEDSLIVGHGWNKVGNNVKTTGSGDQLRIESEKLFSNRVSWRDMRFNIGCKRVGVDTLWMAQRIYRPTEDVNKDYKVKLTGSPYPSMTEKMRKNALFKDDLNFSAIWEIWDARERKIYLMSDETQKDWLEDPKDWPDFLDMFPYDFLSFNDIPDEAYPLSDVAPWNPQVLEKIKVFTMILNHVKRGNRQLIMKKGVMKEQDKDKYEKGIDGAILDAAIAASADLQTAFKFLDYGQMPADYYMILDRLDAVIAKVSGSPAFEQGGQARTQSRTLGELELQKGGSGRRTDRKLDRIERHCEGIARKLMAYRKNNLDVSMVVKVTGKEPPEIIQAFKNEGKYDRATNSIKFSPEDIKGEYDVSVKSGSTLPLDKQTRDQILEHVLELSVPLAQAPSVPPFIAEIITELLQDYEIKGLEVAFKQQEQVAQQTMQNQVQIQEGQVAKTDSETAKRKAQAQQIDTDTIIKTANALGKASGDIHTDASILK